MLPCATRLTTKGAPTRLCMLSWGAEYAPLRTECALLHVPLRAISAGVRAASVALHSQMGADLPLRAVLGVSCCPAPLNGSRNERLCALTNARLCTLSRATLEPPTSSCIAERSEMRADPALHVVLSIPRAADAARRHRVNAKSAPTWLCALPLALLGLPVLLCTARSMQMRANLVARVILDVSRAAEPAHTTLQRCVGYEMRTSAR